MEANQQKSDRITIANVVAIVGLVFLLIFSFLGLMVKFGGSIGWPAIISVAITAVTALILLFLIKAKGAENEQEKWRMFEYGALATYVIFAIIAALFGGLMYFFSINENKEELSNYAEEDLATIENLFTEYNTFWDKAIKKTEDACKNIGTSHCDDSLKQFIRNTDLDVYREAKEKKLFEEEIPGEAVAEKQLYDKFKKEHKSLTADLGRWNIFTIPFAARTIAKYAEEVPKCLDKHSIGANIPVIEENDNNKYTMDGQYALDFSSRKIAENLKMKKALQNAGGFSISGVCIALLIHLFILLNYIVANRSAYTSIRKNQKNGGGITL